MDCMDWNLIFNIIGYVASVLIVFSMVFKTTTYKGTMLMRIINGLGSLAFIVYGFGANAYPTAVTNVAAFVINLVYCQIEWKSHQKELNNTSHEDVNYARALKAFKDGYYSKDDTGKIEYVKCNDIFNAENGSYIDSHLISNYGITWALTRKELKHGEEEKVN